jgi:hypothetical protein
MVRGEFFVRRLIAGLVLSAALATGQIYSPKLLREGQPDAADLKEFVQAIYKKAHATSPRAKAEAIWRFFLTDGRYVKAGFWYHIAGWTYEEPSGEVLDPIKLLNSYGFGLCYHIAPLLEAMFDAGGFDDSRCWFLTGHTVAEVFYDGAYHYFDSDMMGYNVAGSGSFQGKPVSSVHQLEENAQIILGKLNPNGTIKSGTVDYPWYPADVREHAMGDMAELFTSKSNNYVYPFRRYAPGHTMNFVLRPGEKLIRYFAPEEPGLFYLPYKFDGTSYSEFPQEIAQYKIRTADGPRSQKDARLWATGRIEYNPTQQSGEPVTVIDMPSPYVIIDANFKLDLDLRGSTSTVLVETSRDGGKTWDVAGKTAGPRRGIWSIEPRTIIKSLHGRLTAISGTYGYKVRITKSKEAVDCVRSLHLVSRIQLNPRSLPAIESGSNRFAFSSAPAVERVPVYGSLAQGQKRNLRLVDEHGQQYLRPSGGGTGDAIYRLEAGNRELTGFSAGARFLQIEKGLAPDKLTAETRHTDAGDTTGEASIAWSTSPNGPFQELWAFPRKLQWRDGDAIDRMLQWPEVLREVRILPKGTRQVYVRFRSNGPAIDSLRMAVYAKTAEPSGKLSITQEWAEKGASKSHVETLDASKPSYTFEITAGPDVQNKAVIFSNARP